MKKSLLCRLGIHWDRQFGDIIGGGWEGVDYAWIKCRRCGRVW